MSSLTPEAFGQAPSAVAAPTDVDHIRDLMKLTMAMCESGAQSIPQQFAVRGKLNPYDVAMAIKFGETIGVDPLTSLQNVYFINGKAGITANLQRSLASKAGYKFDYVLLRDGKPAKDVQRNQIKSKMVNDLIKENCRLSVEAKVTDRKGNEHPLTVSYNEFYEMGNIKESAASPWVKHPFNMLIAAATRDLVKWYASEALSGISYTTTELLDSGEVVEVDAITEVEVEEEVVLNEDSEPELEFEEIEINCEPMNAEQLQQHLDENAPKQEPAEAAIAPFDLKSELKTAAVTQAQFARKAQDLELVERTTSVAEIAEMKDAEMIFKMTLTALEEDRNG